MQAKGMTHLYFVMLQRVPKHSSCKQFSSTQNQMSYYGLPPWLMFSGEYVGLCRQKLQPGVPGCSQTARTAALGL